MKNIYLQITPFFPTNENFRGPYIYDQVKSLHKNSDYEIIVIRPVSIFYKGSKSYVYQNIKVYNFKVLDFPSSILPGIFNSFNTIRLENFIKNTIAINLSNIKFIHSHVIYPCGVLGTTLGEKYNIVNFIQHHGLDVFQKDNGRILKGFLKKINQKYKNKLFLRIVNKTNLNIGVSQKVINKLCEFEKFTNHNSYILYNGVDTSKFYYINNSDKRFTFIIGCIANFWMLKDHMSLLKALKILIDSNETNILIKFIGSGSTLKDCEKYINENKLNPYVEFLKEIDHTQLNKFYNSLNLFVLPSYYEAFGCVYSEALQVGIPIIAVKNQGIEEILSDNDKKKMLIEKKDYQDLSKKILSYKNHETERIHYNLDINLYVKEFLKYLETRYNEEI